MLCLVVLSSCFALASLISWSSSGSSSELVCVMASKELIFLFVIVCSSSLEMMICGLLLTVVGCPSIFTLVCPFSSVVPFLVVVCSALKISSNLTMCRFADCKSFLQAVCFAMLLSILFISSLIMSALIHFTLVAFCSSCSSIAFWLCLVVISVSQRFISLICSR